MTIFGGLGRGLRRTAKKLGEKLDEILGDNDESIGALSSDRQTLDLLEEALIGADVGVSASSRIIEKIRPRLSSGSINLKDELRQEIIRIFELNWKSASVVNGPKVVFLVGVNGTGKTTTVGKLARLMVSKGNSVLMCAADTFRAAAVEQLKVWAERVEVDIVNARTGTDPASVVYDAVEVGLKRQCDVVLVDTAGRLHNKSNLMAELEKMIRVVSRVIKGAPHEVLLVIDGSVGQNGLAQARVFLEKALVTGIVLTKLDGTAKGGVALAIAEELKLPIRYVGIGEGVDDLLPFSPEEYVDGLLGSES